MKFQPYYVKSLNKKKYKQKSYRAKIKCPICKEKRWVDKYAFKKMKTKQCGSCTARLLLEKHRKENERGPGWRGGRSKTKQGYIRIWIEKEDEYIEMAGRDGRALEHRLVMAKHVGRLLKRNEIIHHKDGNRANNKIENLELLTRKNHQGIMTCPHCQKEFLIK
ncbi:MAG: hypothetical protein DRP09_10970 [Candidatus Thorarchaeota archaeon]|nr:MAG: hypothetical protein DRP09_10970 [Candidatus Thorarchaeota archaeon]